MIGEHEASTRCRWDTNGMEVDEEATRRAKSGQSQPIPTAITLKKDEDDA